MNLMTISRLFKLGGLPLLLVVAGITFGIIGLTGKSGEFALIELSVALIGAFVLYVVGWQYEQIKRQHEDCEKQLKAMHDEIQGITKQYDKFQNMVLRFMAFDGDNKAARKQFIDELREFDDA